MYQKAYPLQELLGSLFDLRQPQVNRWVHRLLPILVRALDRLGCLPERDPGRFSRHERRQGEEANDADSDEDSVPMTPPCE